MPDLTPEQLADAEALIARLESDEVQKHLKPGFEQDFSNSILDQWHDRHWLSFESRQPGKKSQMLLTEEIVSRAEDRAAGRPEPYRGGRSRRYEGWGKRG